MTLTLANDVTLTITRTSNNAVRFFSNKANSATTKITLKDNSSEHFSGTKIPELTRDFVATIPHVIYTV